MPSDLQQPSFGAASSSAEAVTAGAEAPIAEAITAGAASSFADMPPEPSPSFGPCCESLSETDDDGGGGAGEVGLAAPQGRPFSAEGPRPSVLVLHRGERFVRARLDHHAADDELRAILRLREAFLRRNGRPAGSFLIVHQGEEILRAYKAEWLARPKQLEKKVQLEERCGSGDSIMRSIHSNFRTRLF